MGAGDLKDQRPGIPLQLELEIVVRYPVQALRTELVLCKSTVCLSPQGHLSSPCADLIAFKKEFTLWVFCLHACMCTMCMPGARRLEEGVRCQGTRVVDGCGFHVSAGIYNFLFPYSHSSCCSHCRLFLQMPSGLRSSKSTHYVSDSVLGPYLIL